MDSYLYSATPRFASGKILILLWGGDYARPKVKVRLVGVDRQIRPISCQLEMGTLMPQVNGLGGNSDAPLLASAAVQVLSGDRA
ncbi:MULTISPECIES: hypothetical protein [unclassified Microcoleus]|uniref:hypothetical protein n=1 Tax=unclassified Microcoleus TaxID=2642155 RepID=UPI002FD568B4